MHKLEVGQPYVEGKASLPPFTNYNFRGGQHELLLVMDGLTQNEIAAVREGEAEFALVVHRRVVFFLYRFGSAFKWSDCPYSIWLVNPTERRPPEPAEPGTGALLVTILVDADRNLTQALRATGLSPEFTAELHSSINKQLSAEISRADYESAIDDAYRLWPDTDSMLRAAIARCNGGL